MKDKILCVDDEDNILSSYQRQMRNAFDVEVALNGTAGLEVIGERGPFSVIVSDLRMPGMDGIAFLAQARKMSPDSVRVMVTGNADLQTAIQAVNEGNIFQFLTKPCPPETLLKALMAGVRQYQLITSERQLLEKTLQGCVKILTDVLSLVSPSAFGKGIRVRGLVARIVSHLRLENPWKYEIAAMLSQVGCITVPGPILDKIFQGESLLLNEAQMFQSHAQVGHDLIANIPRLEEVARIIAYQRKHYNGDGPPPDGKSGEDILLGARILNVALEFDDLISGGKDSRRALEVIQMRRDRYDPAVVAALVDVIETEIVQEVKKVRLSELMPGMVFAKNVTSVSGLLLVANGQEVTRALRMRLKNFAETMKIKEPISVYVPLGKEG